MFKPNKMYLVKSEPRGADLAKFKFPVVFRVVGDGRGLSYDVTYDDDGVRTLLKDTDTDTTYDDQIIDLRNNKLDKPIIPGDETHQHIVVVNDYGDSATLPIGDLTSDKTYKFLVSKGLGSINEGEEFPEGKTLGEIFQILMSQTYYPTFTNPSLTLSGVSGVREVGETVNFTLTANPNLGAINGVLVNGVWNPNMKQNNRSSSVNKYVLNNTEQIGNTLSVTKITTEGNNTFSGTAYFNGGPQPLDSSSNPYGVSYNGGTATNSISYVGSYKRFYGPSDFVSNPRDLESKFDNESLTWILNTGSTARVFHIYVPKNRVLDTVFDLDALNAPIKDNYIHQGIVIVKDAAGNDIQYNYYKMTNNISYDENHRHEIKIK